jgi:hypothetical protein
VTLDTEVAARLWRISSELVHLPIDVQPAEQPRAATNNSSRSAA